MVKKDQVPDLNLDQSDAVVLIKTLIKKYQIKGTKLIVTTLKERISTKNAKNDRPIWNRKISDIFGEIKIDFYF